MAEAKEVTIEVAAAGAARDSGEHGVERRQKRVMQGVVRSDKMDKTVVVEVTELVKHRVYKKYVSRQKRYMAHDERNEYRPGDVVRIVAEKPRSSRKRWRVFQLVERPT